MERWCGRVALVTGASSGIGAGICRELLSHGMMVVGCARRIDRIQAIGEEEKNAKGKLHAIRCDLTKESEIISMFDEIRNKFGRIDVCINNAGFTHNCTLLNGRTEEWREILEVNVLALCTCTREAVKLMREKNIDDGQIIHISSIFGHLMPRAEMPFFNFYAGTKFMVQALTEGLRRELRSTKSHIRVTSIGPGAVETEFAYRTFSDQAETVLQGYKGVKLLSAEDLAKAVAFVLSSPAHVDVNDMLVRPVEQAF